MPIRQCRERTERPSRTSASPSGLLRCHLYTPNRRRSGSRFAGPGIRFDEGTCMRWTPGDRSNVEDYRGRSGMRLGGGLPIGLGGFVLLLVLSWATGTNWFALLGTGDGTPSESVGTAGEVTGSPRADGE